MDELFRLFESLFPILIFIIWVIVSIFAASKKRRPASSPPPSRQRSETPSSGTVERKTGAVDELKRSLEIIFEDMRHPPRETIPEHRETETLESETLEQKKGADRVSYTRPKQIPVARAAKRAESAYAPFVEAGTLPLPTQQELRKAVIWSEIIGPPISLRE